MVTASLTNYRQSPRKVRLVANLIKGKTVEQAMNMLGVTTKRASDPLAKLLLSAVANAKNLGVSTEGLIVKDCRVDLGLTMKRYMPGARGTAFPLRKKTSHVLLTLAPKNAKGIKAPKAEEIKAESIEAVQVKKAPAKKAASKKTK